MHRSTWRLRWFCALCFGPQSSNYFLSFVKFCFQPFFDLYDCFHLLSRISYVSILFFCFVKRVIWKQCVGLWKIKMTLLWLEGVTFIFWVKKKTVQRITEESILEYERIQRQISWSRSVSFSSFPRFPRESPTETWPEPAGASPLLPLHRLPLKRETLLEAPFLQRRDAISSRCVVKSRIVCEMDLSTVLGFVSGAGEKIHDCPIVNVRQSPNLIWRFVPLQVYFYTSMFSLGDQ